MGVAIVVNAKEIGVAAAEFRKMMARASDRAELLEDIGAAIEETTRERFETQSDPDGTPWTPSRRAKREGGQTLTDRGHLRDSITRKVGVSHVEVGSGLLYAGIHQEGGEIRAKDGGVLAFDGGNGPVFVKSVTIPARPFLGIGAADEEAIEDAVLTFMRRAIK